MLFAMMQVPFTAEKESRITKSPQLRAEPGNSDRNYIVDRLWRVVQKRERG